jgi:hypothetical protein
MPSLLVLCPDLIFSTKIFSTAKALNISAQGVRSLDALREKLTTNVYSKLIIDLNATGVDPLAAITLAKSLPNCPPILAFLSHIQVELAQSATAAGADQVLPRSAFSAKLPELLA